jgi:hypothetical protein
MLRDIDKAAFADSAAKAGAPVLIPGKYPRAWPIETFGREDGSVDFAFVFHDRWHRLPESACAHAAVEVGISAGAFVAPLNYATGVALFLTALERQGWIVLAPNAPDSILDTQTQDELSTP